MFLDLVELDEQSAPVITNSLLKCLEFYGFNNYYLQKHLVAFASDGASVMLGKKSGVASHITSKYPNIIVWHCLNHRLQLAVTDAINDVTAVNHFVIFFDKLYTIYSRSPKNQRELDEKAQKVGEQLRKIGRIFNVRWVASSYAIVSACGEITSLCAIISKLLPKIQKEVQKDRSTFLGMLKRIRSPEFLIDLGLMYDTLHELSNLSLLLQERGTSIVYADKLIRRTIQVLETMKDKGNGTKSLEAKSAATQLKFHCVELTENKKLETVNEKQFLASLINHLRAQLLTTQSSNERKGDNCMTDICKQNYDDLKQQFAVLDETSWPTEIPSGVGEDMIKKLCTRFGLPLAVTLNAFRDYVDDVGRKMPQDLQPLINCTHTVPCSTAECERGFSSMNAILTDSRNQLLVSHVSSLMFIKLHGPPLHLWNPSKYTTTWLRKHRPANDSRTRMASNGITPEDPLWKFF